MERTLVVVKPDGVQRRLIGRIIARFEQKGLKIAGLKMMQMSKNLAERQYAVHKGKKFYGSLIKFITSSPVVVLALEGKGAIAIVRRMMGKTFGSDAEPGTIRGDFAVSNSFNLVHGSDGPETAQAELALFFRPEELMEYDAADREWIYDWSKGQPE
jgi:nucleoside-diphosphate kinase